MIRSSEFYITEFSDLPVLCARGADVVDLIQRISTNDVSALQDGRDVGTVFTTEKGRIAEFCRVLPLEEHGVFALFLSGPLASGFGEWIARYIIMEDAAVDDVPISPRQWFLFREGFEPIEDARDLLKRFRSGGFLAVGERLRGRHWIRVAEADGNGVSDRILADLAPIVPLPPADFTKKRIEAGIPMAGHELTEQYNPLEAGLRDYVSFTKGCYVGQEVIARLDSYKKISRIIVRVAGKGNGTAGAIMAAGKEVGVITSVAPQSPRAWIGLAFLKQAGLGTDALSGPGSSGTVTVLDEDPFKAAYSLSND